MAQNTTTILPGKKKFIYAIAPAIVTILNAVAVQATGKEAIDLPAAPATTDYVIAGLQALMIFFPSIVTWVTGMFALSKENARDTKRADNQKEVEVEYQKARPAIEKAISEARQAEKEAEVDVMSVEDFQEKVVRPYAKYQYHSDKSNYMLYAAQMKLRNIDPVWKGTYLISLAKKAFLDLTGYTYEAAVKGIADGTLPECSGGEEMDTFTIEKGIGAYSVWQELEALLDKYGKR